MKGAAVGMLIVIAAVINVVALSRGVVAMCASAVSAVAVSEVLTGLAAIGLEDAADIVEIAATDTELAETEAGGYGSSWK